MYFTGHEVRARDTVNREANSRWDICQEEDHKSCRAAEYNPSCFSLYETHSSGFRRDVRPEQELSGGNKRGLL